MNRINRTGRDILFTLPWAGLTLVSALCLRALNWGAEPGSLIAHLKYGLVYNLHSNILDFLLLCALCLGLAVVEGMALRREERRLFFPGLLLALLFSLNTLIFQSPTGRLENLFRLPGCGQAESMLHWLCQTGSWYGLSLAFFRWMSRPLTPGTDTVTKKDCVLWAGVMLVLWVPVFVLRFPGSIYLDTDVQVLQFLGKYPWEASNPIFLTFVYGPLFWLGRAVAGDNGGIFLCVLFQIGLTLFAFTFACREVAKARGSRRAGLVLSLFFGLMPNYPSFVASALKDFIHAPLYLLFALYLRRCVRGEDREDLRKLLILAVLCALTRKGAIYLVALCLLGLCLVRKDRRRLLAFCAWALVVGHLAFNNWLLPALGVEKPMEKENYSFFYPITGYYCQNHGQELSAQEREIIGGVLDYDTVCTGFSQTGVDAIKTTYHAQSKDQVQAYLKLHGSFLRRHPITCLEAVVYVRNYYFTPWTTQGERITVTQYPFQSLTEGAESSFTYVLPEAVRKPVEHELWTLLEQPVLRELTGSGSYVWLGLLLFGTALWQKDRKKQVWLLSVTILTAGLLLTHLNGALRYASPIIYTVPVFLGLYREEG